MDGIDLAGSQQVVATLNSKGSGRSLILQAHIDVVPEGPADLWDHPPFSGAVHDGWMFGRGAQDMKAGVSAMIFALDAIRDAGYAPGGRVHLQTVTEEEKGISVLWTWVHLSCEAEALRGVSVHIDASAIHACQVERRVHSQMAGAQQS